MLEKKMSVKGDFGRLLKSLRIRSEIPWTQESLAEALRDAECKASLRTYKKWEKGESIPSPEPLKHIVALLGLNKEDEDALYRAAAQAPPNVELDSSADAQMPPIIDNLPFRPNPFFTGRETELEQLRTQLQEIGTAAITQPVSISGMGGIGKTELALEYAHSHYPDVYRTVLWVNAADEGSLQASYDSILQLLKLSDYNAQGPDQRIQVIKDWLRKHTGWLLIMDNADDLPLANSFLPSQPLGHILFTTRSQHVSDSDVKAQIKVEEMGLENGLLFLLRRSGRMQDEDNLDAAQQVVELLGGLPLALDQAGAYIAGTDISFADYLKRYSMQRHCLLSKRRLTESTFRERTRHPESVTVTFKLIFEELSGQYPLATDVLSFCAFLHPDAVPEELFQYDDSFKPNTVEFDEAFTTFRRYSLLKRNTQERTFSIHRLVQAVIIDMLSPELRAQWRERVMQALNAAFPKVEFKEWSKCERFVPHVQVCATWTEHELTPAQEVAELFNKAGFYLLERGQYLAAEPLLARALSIREQQLGAEHLDTVASLHSLAVLYRRLGKYEQAETLYLQALSIYEQRLGAEHPDTASVLNDLAELYVRVGKYEQGEKLYLRVLTVREQLLGADHLDTIESLHNLAELYRRQGKYEQAELLYQRVLSIRKKLLGDDHPDIASLLHDMARLYDDQGKYEQAEELFQLALNIQESHLGPDHPDTALSLHNLAALYWRQGKYEQAEPLCQRALMIRKNQLGTEHPDTARSLNGMALLYLHQGNYEQAEVLWLQNLAITEQQPGTEGFYAAYPLHGLARILQDRGEHKQAEALYQRALSIQEQQLRPTRLNSKTTRNDYALFLRRIGRDAEATAVESSQS